MKGEFQNMIRRRRVSGRRLTVAYLAELAGIGRSQLQQMLSGKRAGGESWPKVLQWLTREEARAIGREPDWERVAFPGADRSTGNSVAGGTKANAETQRRGDAEKKARLFYYDPDAAGWCPSPADLAGIEGFVDLDSMEPGVPIVVRFMRRDMTEKEMEALPEV
jgi:transcriptional regulator with XRE-family HTH domain